MSIYIYILLYTCVHTYICIYVHASTHTHARLTSVFLVQGVPGSISTKTPNFAAMAWSTPKTPLTVVAAATPSTTQPSSLAKRLASSCRSSRSLLASKFEILCILHWSALLVFFYDSAIIFIILTNIPCRCEK